MQFNIRCMLQWTTYSFIHSFIHSHNDWFYLSSGFNSFSQYISLFSLKKKTNVVEGVQYLDHNSETRGVKGYIKLYINKTYFHCKEQHLRSSIDKKIRSTRTTLVQKQSRLILRPYLVEQTYWTKKTDIFLHKTNLTIQGAQLANQN